MDKPLQLIANWAEVKGVDEGLAHSGEGMVWDTECGEANVSLECGVPLGKDRGKRGIEGTLVDLYDKARMGLAVEAHHCGGILDVLVNLQKEHGSVMSRGTLVAFAVDEVGDERKERALGSEYGKGSDLAVDVARIEDSSGGDSRYNSSGDLHDVVKLGHIGDEGLEGSDDAAC